MGSHIAPAGHDSRDGNADETAVRLRAAGLSPTPRRRRVLQALGLRLRPVGAHELYVELTRRGHNIGVTTVYRTLSALAGAGQLHVFVRDGETRYRLCAQGRHYHLVCRRCGDVQEHPAADSGWLDGITATADFLPDPHETEVHGLCGRCLRGQSDDPAG
ncbi:transcriptional repressor [Actinomadura soli]|uniref:Transcriptional repressor n=1 Tax=Actinomadura soli TaxID=2508997 RepID=A0A5C4J669_9ACTN|nr:Fur family transcriptional regulator [Actinomadura soli]TMQ92908.1 transcriptional repressor [Actinomadura soli]